MTSHHASSGTAPPGPRAPRLRRAVTTALLLLAGCLTAVAFSALGPPQARADTVPGPPAGWNTVFSDNFAGPAGSAPSAANWFYDIGTGYGTGETEQTTSSTSNVYLDGNGHLVLKATDNGGTWTSGRIESTRDDFQAPAGGKLEMTAEIEQPNPASGLGYWPAFWALGSPMRTGGGWPQSGEIDMMEDVNAGNAASQTLHDSAGSSGHALIACPDTASTCQTGYHTYSVIVDRTNTSAETLQFLMDGTVESTITEASVGTAAWQAAIDHGFFIIFDLAMGGNYPDGICNCTSPTSATTSGASMSVGYVAVYEQGGNSTPAGTATATGPLTGLSGNCLSNQNSLNTEGNPIYLSGCNGSAGQQWSTYSDGTLRVQGGCLDVVSAGTTSGTDVDWYACNGTAAQDWTHQSNGELVNPSSGLCLTDPGGNNGSRLDIETCTGAADQQWTLPAGSGGGGGGGGSGSGGTCGTANVALGKTATASSTESGAYPAANAVDGNTATRWSSAFSDPQWLEVDLGSTQSICSVGLDWEAAYATGFQIQTSADGTNWTSIYSTTTGTGGNQTLSVTGTGRYIRMYGTARATQYGYSLWEFQVFTAGSGGGTGGSCGTTNAALNQPTTASSVQNASFPAADATDGNAGTRWSSAFSDPQWLEVDLGSSQSICGVSLNWEAAYATAFQIQTSTDGTTWTSIYSTTTGTGGVQNLAVSGTGRYIRMYGTARATQYGYSIWEFQVFTSGSGGGGGGGGGGGTGCTGGSNTPNLGPNVYVFTPSESAATINSTLNTIFNAQKTNQFGTQRDAELFMPGTYNGVEDNVGYYTTVQGLGQNPDQVSINGDVTLDSFDGTGNATDNFWRSAENMEITPSAGSDRWAAAQASPFERMDIHGGLELYPASYGYASGGYLANDVVTGQASSVSQQQYYTKDSTLGSWSGSVWNMVFSGVNGAPAQSFPSPPMTTLATTPVSRDIPYLYVDSSGNYNVFEPSLRTNASGPSWASGSTPGTSVPMSQFFVATPSDTAAQINTALASGCNLLFTPGVYNINQTLNVTNPNTVVLGIGMPTLIPAGGVNTMQVADVDGVRIQGLLFDAGTTNSSALLTIGTQGNTTSHASNPISVQDTYFRIGGDIAGQATNSLVVNADNTLIDDIWAWRADHGNAGTVGWTVNTAQHGLVVNGNNVLATGLAVEHYQNYDVQWLGNGGETIFFQNEMPYDPPNQAAWMNGSSDGYAAYEVGPNVTTHQAYGLGSYCYFNVNPAVVADHAFEAPDTPGVQFHDVLTVSLGNVGVIEHVINETGAATPTNTTPSTVTSYP